MKKYVLFICFLAGVLFFTTSVSSAATKGRIVFYDNRQIVWIPLKQVGNTLFVTKEFISGATTRIRLGKITAVNFNSDRTGWTENSIAVTSKKTIVESGGMKWLKMIIPNTFDNDWGIWTFETATGFLWFNIDQFAYKNKNWTKDEDMIRYGDFHPSIISFDAGIPTIQFGCNGIVGFVDPIFPEEVSEIIWNSDKVGWVDASTARGKVMKNDLGHYYTDIENLPDSDTGTICAVLSDGSVVWLNVNWSWEYSSNVTVDAGAGLISYTMP